MHVIVKNVYDQLVRLVMGMMLDNVSVEYTARAINAGLLAVKEMEHEQRDYIVLGTMPAATEAEQLKASAAIWEEFLDGFYEDIGKEWDSQTYEPDALMIGEIFTRAINNIVRSNKNTDDELNRVYIEEGVDAESISQAVELVFNDVNVLRVMQTLDKPYFTGADAVAVRKAFRNVTAKLSQEI